MCDDMRVHSFIEPAEFSYFADIANKNFSGAGLIVDAGCFAGTSTLALSGGVGKSLLAELGRRMVIAIDRFVVVDEYIANHFLESGVDIRFGESFLRIFLDNVKEYIDHIDVRAGDLLQVGRIDSPIEILAIDVAKSPALNNYILRHWFHRMIPGKSLIIHQDFYAPAQPWLPISMGGLMEYFSLYGGRVGETQVFKLERQIPEDALRAVVGTDWRSPNGLGYLELMIEQIPQDDRASLILMKSLILNRIGRVQDARATLSSLIRSGARPDIKKWEKWLAMAHVAIEPDVFSPERLLANVYINEAAIRLGHWQ